MKKYVKEFMKRGLMFGGFGPIVAGIVFMILGFCNVEINLEGWQIFLAIASTYVLAFVQAGASVFEQVEEWSTFKSALIHMLTIYVIYVGTYLANSWIPFDWLVIVIFSGAIILTFLLIWFICYFVTKKFQNQLNANLK